MTLLQKIALACVATILFTCKYGSCKDYTPFPMCTFTMQYSDQICATWAVGDQTILVSQNGRTTLVDVNTGVKQPLPTVPQLLTAVRCNDGKFIIAEGIYGVWMLNVQDWSMKPLGTPSPQPGLAAIDKNGKRAIINTSYGCCIYNLENMTLIKRINPSAGFRATSFDPAAANIVTGTDEHYGKVSWDIETDSIVKILDRKALYFSSGNIDEDTYRTMQAEYTKNRTSHFRYVYRMIDKTLCLVDQQTGKKTPLPPLSPDTVFIEPSSNGARLISWTEKELSVIDIASKKTIYKMKLRQPTK